MKKMKKDLWEPGIWDKEKKASVFQINFYKNENRQKIFN